MASPEPPPIDAHAHIATDVTAGQVRHLDGAVIFAVTRGLSEAAAVPHGCHANLIWGIGVHPGDRESLDRYRGERFEALLPRFALVGEVGLDRRAGHLDRQREVLTDILARTAEIPVMLSIHSTREQQPKLSPSSRNTMSAARSCTGSAGAPTRYARQLTMAPGSQSTGQ